MRKLSVSGFVLILAASHVALAKDPPSTGSSADPRRQLAQGAAAKEPEGEIVRARGAKTPPNLPAVPAAKQNVSDASDAAPQQNSAVAKRILDQLLAAYQKTDSKTLAGLFTADGEYIDSKGIVFHGRKAIDDEFAAFFKEMPGTAIEIDLNATRSIAKGVIASDGLTRFKRTSASVPAVGACHVVFVQEGDAWLIASLHEDDVTESKSASHHDQVSQLEWLIGDWIGEGSHSHVHFTCRWDGSKNYILRDFSVQIAGEKAVSGTQFIGYDPVAGHLKTWIFDSAGGFSDGYFHHDRDAWVVRTSGVTSDGHIASQTALIKPIDKNRMTLETTDRVIGGVRVADPEKVTIVRKPPESRDRTNRAEPKAP